MKFNTIGSTKLAMTFATSLVAAVGTAAGATVWQSFGKPKVEEIAEKRENEKPKRTIGFNSDWSR